jgi:hypothetical protein|eukprot:COSAG01_NODE_3070_length_6638_cov_14.873528_3_plen_115_part_00
MSLTCARASVGCCSLLVTWRRLLAAGILDARWLDHDASDGGRRRRWGSWDRSSSELTEISLRFYVFAIPLSPPAPVLTPVLAQRPRSRRVVRAGAKFRLGRSPRGWLRSPREDP